MTSSYACVAGPASEWRLIWKRWRPIWGHSGLKRGAGCTLESRARSSSSSPSRVAPRGDSRCRHGVRSWKAPIARFARRRSTVATKR